MEKTKKTTSPLFDLEMDTLEEGREWTRKRLEKKLQKLADKQSAISPPKRTTPKKGKKNFIKH
jgi:hypothetical protein